MTNRSRIVFFGDSITEYGGQESGYVTLLEGFLREEFGNSTPEIVNAGISGNKVTNLQARVKRDVISLRPTVVVIYIGINDVWHFTKPERSGTAKDQFEEGIEKLTWRLLDAGSQVILCTPSVIGEKPDGENSLDEMLAEYADVSRSVAKRTGAFLCDLHARFNSYLAEHNPEKHSEGVLTLDGVHLNDRGNRLVAQTMLEALRPLLRPIVD